MCGYIHRMYAIVLHKTLKLLTTLKSELGSKRLQSRGLLNPVVNLDRVYYRIE